MTIRQLQAAASSLHGHLNISTLLATLMLVQGDIFKPREHGIMHPTATSGIQDTAKERWQKMTIFFPCFYLNEEVRCEMKHAEEIVPSSPSRISLFSWPGHCKPHPLAV